MAKFTAPEVCSLIKIGFKTVVPYPFPDKAIGASLRGQFEEGLTHPSNKKTSLAEFLSGEMRDVPLFRIGPDEADLVAGVLVYEEARRDNNSVLVFGGTYRDISVRDYLEIFFAGNLREIFIACARHGERVPFGFSIPDPPERKHSTDRHLSLVFPGRSGGFDPLYIGIKRSGKEEYFCLEAYATSDISDVKVHVRKATTDEVPFFLQMVCLK